MTRKKIDFLLISLLFLSSYSQINNIHFTSARQTNSSIFFEDFSNMFDWEYNASSTELKPSDLIDNGQLKLMIRSENGSEVYVYVYKELHYAQETIINIELMIAHELKINDTLGLKMTSLLNNSLYVNCSIKRNEEGSFLTMKTEDWASYLETDNLTGRRIILSIKFNESKSSAAIYGKDEISVPNPFHSSTNIQLDLYALTRNAESNLTAYFDNLLVFDVSKISPREGMTLLNDYWLTVFNDFMTPDPEHYDDIWTRDSTTAFLSDLNEKITLKTYETILDRIINNISPEGKVPDHFRGRNPVYDPSPSISTDNNAWLALAVSKYHSRFGTTPKSKAYYSAANRSLRWYDQYFDGKLWFFPPQSSDWRDTIHKSGYISSTTWLLAVAHGAFGKMANELGHTKDKEYSLNQLRYIYKNYKLLLSTSEDYFVSYRNETYTFDGGGEYDSNSLAVISNVLPEGLEKEIKHYMGSNLQCSYGGFRTPIVGYYPDHSIHSPPDYYLNGGYWMWQNSMLLEVLDETSTDSCIQQIFEQVKEDYGCLHEHYNINGTTIRGNGVVTTHQFFGSMEVNVGEGIKQLLFNPMATLTIITLTPENIIRVNGSKTDSTGKVNLQLVKGSHILTLKLGEHQHVSYLLNAEEYRVNRDLVQVKVQLYDQNRTIEVHDNELSDKEIFIQYASSKIVQAGWDETHRIYKIMLSGGQGTTTTIKADLGDAFPEGIEVNSDSVIVEKNFNSQNILTLKVQADPRTEISIRAVETGAMSRYTEKFSSFFLSPMGNTVTLLSILTIFLLLSYVRAYSIEKNELASAKAMEQKIQ